MCRGAHQQGTLGNFQHRYIVATVTDGKVVYRLIRRLALVGCAQIAQRQPLVALARHGQEPPTLLHASASGLQRGHERIAPRRGTQPLHGLTEFATGRQSCTAGIQPGGRLDSIHAQIVEPCEFIREVRFQCGQRGQPPRARRRKAHFLPRTTGHRVLQGRAKRPGRHNHGGAVFHNHWVVRYPQRLL